MFTEQIKTLERIQDDIHETRKIELKNNNKEKDEQLEEAYGNLTDAINILYEL